MTITSEWIGSHERQDHAKIKALHQSLPPLFQICACDSDFQHHRKFFSWRSPRKSRAQLRRRPSHLSVLTHNHSCMPDFPPLRLTDPIVKMRDVKQHSLKWERDLDWDLDLKWTMEPDTAIIADLAKQHLASKVRGKTSRCLSGSRRLPKGIRPAHLRRAKRTIRLSRRTPRRALLQDRERGLHDAIRQIAHWHTCRRCPGF